MLEGFGLDGENGQLPLRRWDSLEENVPWLRCHFCSSSEENPRHELLSSLRILWRGLLYLANYELSGFIGQGSIVYDESGLAMS
jgi:hypothetical protein